MNEHNSDCGTKLTIHVYIQGDATSGYTFQYEGVEFPVDPNTGNFQLPGGGPHHIVYKLCTDGYQLLWVNLDDLERCATNEISCVKVDRANNSITITDRNSDHVTKMTPFSLRLVVRRTDLIGTGFMSPDPQVTNNPNPSLPGGSG